MTRVVVIGCGVVGAAIAYELSQVPELQVTVLDQHLPGQAATGAALGVLMGAISQKAKGRAIAMRFASLQRYETLIPELEALTGKPLAFNRQGILALGVNQSTLASWAQLVEIRRSQGWNLQLLDRPQLQADFPQVQGEAIVGALYSPQDRQVDPTALTSALVTAAASRGVTFRFQTQVMPPLNTMSTGWHELHTSDGVLTADWVVVAAGLGTSAITTALHASLEIRPVLGQALQVHLPQPLGHAHLQPVITCEDVHLVPVGDGNYWIGATVEFPPEQGELVAEPDLLQRVREQAIAFCPALSTAKIVRTWSGLRPRPTGRPAPVIEFLPGHPNVLVASGHYRNGVLLAPATAEQVRRLIKQEVVPSTPPPETPRYH